MFRNGVPLRKFKTFEVPELGSSEDVKVVPKDV
jgi:hypothetical protein